MKIIHRLIKDAKAIYVCMYNNKIIMHQFKNRLINEYRKYDIGCWNIKYK